MKNAKTDKVTYLSALPRTWGINSQPRFNSHTTMYKHVLHVKQLPKRFHCPSAFILRTLTKTSHWKYAKTNIRLTYNPSKSFDSSNNMPYQHPFPTSELGPRPELRLLRVLLSPDWQIRPPQCLNHTYYPGYHNETTQDKRKIWVKYKSHSSLLILTDVISHFQRKNKRGNIRTCSLTNLQTRILYPSNLR